jgi:hypothetical protein
MKEFIRLNNPYSLDETLEKLRYVLSATSTETNFRSDALALLEKAISRSCENQDYAIKMEQTLLHGSTLELRDLLSVFGEYMESARNTFPPYPYRDAVNGIDSAMHIIKFDAVNPGAMQEHIWYQVGSMND